MKKDKCVTCNHKLRTVKLFSEQGKMITDKTLVVCNPCNVFYLTKDGFIGEEW